MIVPMKKAAIIVQNKDASAAVQELRKLGLLHVEHQKLPQGQDINTLREDIALVNAAIAILSETEFVEAAGKKQLQLTQDWKFVAKHVIDLYKRLDHLIEYSRTLKQRINEWVRWGDFDPEAIQRLSAKDIFVRLYQIPVAELTTVPANLSVKKIFTAAGIAHCVVIARQKIELGFPEVPLPKLGLEKMRARLYEDGRMMEIIQDDICKYVAYSSSLINIRKKLEKDLELQQALKGMGQAGDIMYLTGYTPYDTVAVLEACGRKEKWGMMLSEPSDEDNVPTLVRSPRWVSIISPVFKLIEIIPGYRELDISPLFLIFLSLFFGMIIGDAGYGAIYFLATFCVHKLWRKKFSNRQVFFLFYVFSICAIFWGLLTGTVFGQEWYLKAGLKPIIPVLNDTKFLQALCFFIGALHLTLAHAWQAIRKAPSVTSLADVGWIAILWAAFFLAKTLILDHPFPFFGKWLIMAGLGLVIFCSNPNRNIFKMIGQGLGTVALNLMNNFTDVVSYVRLFAVGLAGVAIADTVNTLAAGLGNNIFTKMLVVFIGHTLNIILGPMSVLVHGIRLNVLEFSSHASLSWSGLAYKPLKE